MAKQAIIFPGQGCQSVGMGLSLTNAYPELKKLFDTASEILGCDLAQTCFEGPPEELTRSDRAQPAIFVVSIAAYLALQKERNTSFDATAGLSSGEWAALHIADVVTFEDALRILEARGRFMQEACMENAGGMLSVMGLSMEQLQEVCEKSKLQIANYNSPVQTVLSGALEAVEKGEALAKELGARRALRLEVAGAFHSELMRSAAEKFGAFLKEIPFAEPKIPVLSNVTGVPHTGKEDVIRRMEEQITSSVRWVDNVEWMKEYGISEYIECGSGKVLTGLIKRIDNQASLHNIHDQASLKQTLENIK